MSFHPVSEKTRSYFQHVNSQANESFNSKHYRTALGGYTEALNLAWSYPFLNHEIPKQLCNKSTVLWEMRRYSEALQDAYICMDNFPYWIDGYWKAAQAAKLLGQPNETVSILVAGLDTLQQSEDSYIKFFCELVTILCPVKVRLGAYKLQNCPSQQVLEKILGRFIFLKAWECVSCLVTGRCSGNNNELAMCIPPSFRYSFVPVGNLLKETKPTQLVKWGFSLAAYLLENGASYSQMEMNHGKAAIHIGVQTALQTGSLDFIQFLLGSYIDSPEKHNMIDENGDTAVHVVVKSRMSYAGFRTNLLRLLLDSGCSGLLPDMANKLPIEYLTQVDPRYRVLQPSRQDKAQKWRKTSADQTWIPPLHQPKLNDKCNFCQTALKENQNLIKSRPTKSYIEMTKVIKITDHSKEIHEPIVNEMLTMIINSIAQTLNPEIPERLVTIPFRFYEQIVNGLMKGEYFRQLGVVVEEYCKRYGCSALKDYAKGINIQSVISHSSLKQSHQLMSKIIKSMLKNGAIMENDGKDCIETAVHEEQFKILETLFEIGACPSHLSLSNGDTPIHAALFIALEKDKGNFSLFNSLTQMYDKDPEKYHLLDPSQQDKHGDCLFHLVAKAKYCSTVHKATEILCDRKIPSNIKNKDGKLPMNYLSAKNDRRRQFFLIASTVSAGSKKSKTTKQQKKSSKRSDASLISENRGKTEAEHDLQQFSRSDDIPEVIKESAVSQPLRKDALRKKIDEMIRNLDDSAYSKYSGRGSTVERSSKRSKSAQVDQKAIQSVPVQEDSSTLPSTKDRMSEPKVNVLNTSISEKESETHDIASKSVQVEPKSESPTSEELKVGFKYERLSNNNEENKTNVETTILYLRESDTCNINSFRVGCKEDGTEVEKPEDKEVERVQIIPNCVDNSDDDEDDNDAHFQFDPQVFENLEWEVECTADVWKALRDKHVTPELKQRIVRKIQLLAAGEWTSVIRKKLNHVPKTLRLYEAKFSKGCRIIWELAIAFSPRLSESGIMLKTDEEKSGDPVKSGRIYSEIIRVWDIVFDHDKIFSSVQRIVKSHERGESCIIQKRLKNMQHEQYSNEKKRIPRKYEETDVEKGQLEEIEPFYPPASANETEYHILKFYSFSSNLVSHILQNIEIKVDFPFRVTDLEHAIINLESNVPILLLGRSGTGKTTCCLYRLWSRFLRYWTRAKESNSPLLPRTVLYTTNDRKDEQDRNIEDDEENVEEEEHQLERQKNAGSEQGACCMSLEDDELPVLGGENDFEQQYDHLHQLFITKNSVLCREVQKNFRELIHACDVAKEHTEVESQSQPHRLQDLSEYQYPLFVTSRQLLLMLDASLEAPYFFDRAEDGSLKVDIEGWTDGDGLLSILPLLQEDSDDDSDDEGDLDFNVNDGGDDNENRNKKHRKVDPRKEMTYELFAETIWPHINKGVGKKYHPSLVWTEIMSFIKGSYEALSKSSGHLNEEEYLDLGRKRAPNFPGQREHIYTLFKQYEHVRKQKFYFDETDLVKDIYHRICEQKEMNWVIHQVFVDETQDFTQAELCLLLRLCQSPNEMFLTGDTAQSIMRGISFRFNDLKSLFYYASQSFQVMGKVSGIAVPKQVYQLTHNYRSHAGILSLASSILDLMVKFFPESFDRLNKDQGLFHGPKPILLESCSASDLAMLLRGNKRKTSHIEFGAHQAILVVNEAARENVPEELQYGLILTIYESKGLEFDDILLYNFFKDSQASKEWRVVTNFLESLCEETVVDQESLVPISLDFMQQKGRPRALSFDEKKHKVLNSELKHLYTAVTRARVNVWIFDEDMTNRAPMFEYFKARKLVKVISSGEANSSEGMFAEESTPEQWIERAEDFMKHNLYEVAAKCYRCGEDLYMERVAMTHQKALNATRIKDNPSRMRNEFLFAADQYLEVGLPVKAAICLQNAREKELLAHLYEKMGQLEKAAETYKRLRKPVECSSCYERLGYFDKAVTTLYDHEKFDMANDTLKRYYLLIKEFESEGKPVPKHLIDHKPAKHYTEEQLAFAGANLYHKLKKPDKMLASLNILPSIDKRVSFLKQKHKPQNNYMSYAAEMLKENGKVKAAAILYLEQGQIEEALRLFTELEEKDFVGYCHILKAKTMSSVEFNGTAKCDDLELVSRELKGAIDIFNNLKDVKCYKFNHPKIGAGEAELLLGQLTGDFDRIKAAFGNFTHKHFNYKYKVGQLECTNWLIYNGDLSDSQNIQRVMNGIRTLFEVLKVLVAGKDNITDGNQLVNIHSFYGLEIASSTKLVYNLQHHPRIVELLRQNADSDISGEISSNNVNTIIAEFLIKRGKNWFEKIQEEIATLRKNHVQCSLYAAGIRKEQCCVSIHRKLTHRDILELLELDQWNIELECIVDDGIGELMRAPLNKDFKLLLENFIEDKYKSCKVLLNDLIQNSGHGAGISDTVQDAVATQKEVSQYYYAKQYINRFLKTKYGEIMDKKSRKRGENVELFMKMGFVQKLMKLNIDVDNALYRFEKDVQMEYDNGMKISMKEIGFLLDKGRTVMCVGRRFQDAFLEMYSSNNKSKNAMLSFAAFIQLIRKHEALVPETSLLMMWIEFFTTTSLCMQCKFSTMESPFFVIPSSYVSLVYFIDSSYKADNGISTFESVTRQRYAPEEDKIRNRIDRFIGILAGTDNGVNIIRRAFQGLMEVSTKVESVEHQLEEPTSEFTDEILTAAGIAERVLICGLVFLINMDKTVYSTFEPNVMREFCQIDLPSLCPPRLTRAVDQVKSSKGTGDLAKCLKELLQGREDDLLFCRWDEKMNKREGLIKVSLENFNLFKSSFCSEKTSLAATNPEIVLAEHKPEVEEDHNVSEEHNQMHRAAKQKFEIEEKRKKSADVILRYLRHVAFLKKCKTLKKLCEEALYNQISEGSDLLRDIKVNEEMCGFCGEIFQNDKDEELDNPRRIENGIFEDADNSTPQKGLHDIFEGMEGYMNINGPSSIQGLTPLQAHVKLDSHRSKQEQYKWFQNNYINEIKIGIDEVSVFIQKYELQSSYIVESLYKAFSLKVSDLVDSLEKVESLVASVVNNKEWDNPKVMQYCHEMIGHLNDVEPLVIEGYKDKEKILRKPPVESGPTEENLSGEEEQVEDIASVVDEPGKHQDAAGRKKHRKRKGKYR